MTAPGSNPPEGATSLAQVSRNGRSLATPGTSTSIVMLTDPHSPAAEAYRTTIARAAAIAEPAERSECVLLVIAKQKLPAVTRRSRRCLHSFETLHCF